MINCNPTYVFLLLLYFRITHGKLLFSHVIFSNGEHYSPKSLEAHTYEEFKRYQEEDSLTSNGIQQGYNAGKFLRMWYEDFINGTYSPSQVHAISSVDDISLATGQSVLAGLYPPMGDQIWNRNVLWQPVPLHTDEWVMVPSPCGAYDEKHSHLFEFSQDVHTMVESNRDFIIEMRKHLSLTGMPLMKIFKGITEILSQKCHPNATHELPWITNDMEKNMLAMRDRIYKINYTNPELVFYKSGLFLQLIKNNTDLVLDENSTKRKLFLYSTKNSAMISLLSSLGVWDKIVPSCCSILMLEIHQSHSKSYNIQILYKNDTIADWTRDPIKLQIPGCSRNCPLNFFMDKISPLLIHDQQSFAAHCDENHISRHKEGTILAITMFLLATGCLFLVIGTLCYKRSQHDNPKFSDEAHHLR